MQLSHERRKGNRRIAKDELSPEFLAMLVVCGGKVRNGDREVQTDEAVEQRHGRRAEDEAKVEAASTASRLAQD